MKANETSLTSFLSQNKTQFIIPVYQRNYDWTEQQCQQLFEDLLRVGSKPAETHFIGSIVFIHDGVYSSSATKQLVIIDGQQRLTTFSILYLVLYKFAKSNKLEEKANEIFDSFIINKYVKDDFGKLKLKQSDANSKAFNYLLTENEPANYQEFSRVIENYNFFFRKITVENFDTILRGLDALLFVEISLERGKDDPQRIFESLNSTGLELSQADLIRNYILMGLAPEEQVKVFNSYWDIIESNARDIEHEESKVSDFIRDYLTYRSKKIPTKSRVYEEFKARYPSRDLKFYGETLTEIRAFSFYYSKFINPSKEADVAIRRELQLIQRLEINICYPFLLPVFHDFYEQFISKDALINVLKLIQSYVWRRFIVNFPTSGMNKVFMTLYTDINKKDYINSLERSLVRKKGTLKFPTNEEVETALQEKDVYNIQAKNRTYLLELLENHNNREFVAVDNPDITIEHIFPQNPADSWYSTLADEDLRLLSEKYLHTIANLTLSGNNGSLSNKGFTEKKTMNKEGKEQGYAFSRLWLNQFLKQIDEWNVARLQERYRLLYERFVEIWEYPDVEADEELDDDEDFTIYDAPDPKHRKLDYFVFRDEKIETDEISRMYYHVVQTLYNENPSAFYHSDIKELLNLSTNPNDLRAPQAISASYYIESNIDSGNKFKRLRNLLPKFNAEDDLLINFSSVLTKSRTQVLDREHWMSKVPADILSTVDVCFDLLASLDQNIKPVYKRGYIGIQRNGDVDNFVLFVPSRAFVRIVIRVPNAAVWVPQLISRNLDFLSIGRKGGRLKFRVKKEQVINNKDFLTELFSAAVDHAVA